MTKKMDNRTRLVDHYMTTLKNQGILQVVCENAQLSDQYLTIDSQQVLNFGSCSYMNLELDERLTQGAIEAIQNYGIHFSCSRAYMSIPLYNQFEYLLEQIFEHPTIVTPTTTLAHLANIPHLIGANDLILLDHQVHNSVQNAVGIAKSKGATVGLIRHNDMDKLEERIIEAEKRYDAIWYMADGIYSMFGDFVPAKRLEELLNRYPTFNIYIDDAHGMSWIGNNGKGYVLNEIDMHDRMVVTVSLSKGFGAGGGATIMKDRNRINEIRNCGSTHIFSGPLQPPLLGASIVSAQIHLSQEITEMQNALQQNISYFRTIADEYNIQLVSNPLSPIQYIMLGQDTLAVNMCRELLKLGFYSCVAGYPSVSKNSAGIRITLNRNHTKAEIRNLVVSISSVLTKEYQGDALV